MVCFGVTSLFLGCDVMKLELNNQSQYLKRLAFDNFESHTSIKRCDKFNSRST